LHANRRIRREGLLAVRLHGQEKQAGNQGMKAVGQAMIGDAQSQEGCRRRVPKFLVQPRKRISCALSFQRKNQK
jgi:hypothetical protein